MINVGLYPQTTQLLAWGWAYQSQRIQTPGCCVSKRVPLVLYPTPTTLIARGQAYSLNIGVLSYHRVKYYFDRFDTVSPNQPLLAWGQAYQSYQSPHTWVKSYFNRVKYFDGFETAPARTPWAFCFQLSCSNNMWAANWPTPYENCVWWSEIPGILNFSSLTACKFNSTEWFSVKRS